MNISNVFYVSGSDKLVQPGGGYKLKINARGIKIYKPGVRGRDFLSMDQIKNVATEHQVFRKGSSPEGAIAGGLLFGAAGAIAGASMNSPQVQSSVNITYRNSKGKSTAFVLITPKAEKIKKEILAMI